MSMSLDGFVAGPDQSEEQPLGRGSLALHRWQLFVLTHHAREPIEMAGGTTFHFVTDGFDSALAAGALDELVVDIAPVVLGRGESMFTELTDVSLTQIEVAHSPHATHIRYRVASGPRHAAARGRSGMTDRRFRAFAQVDAPHVDMASPCATCHRPARRGVATIR